MAPGTVGSAMKDDFRDLEGIFGGRWQRFQDRPVGEGVRGCRSHRAGGGTKANLKAWMAPVEVPVPVFLRETGHKAMVYREPYGVSLIMGPFNGPLLLLMRPAITALAAGNTCILKVSEAPATATLLLDLVPKYFEPGALTALAASRDEAAALLLLPFDFIFFTGGARVGRIVMRAAAENLTPVLLELGGQNPALVDKSANLRDAAKKIIWGATAWGGQWCTSPGYAYVHEF